MNEAGGSAATGWAECVLGDVAALVDKWVDKDGESHIGLFWLVAHHLDPTQMADDEPIRVSSTSSRPPWDPRTAEDVWGEAHAGIRHAECDLLFELAFVTRPPRPGSDRHTHRAFHHTAVLIERAATHQDVRTVLVARHWARAIRRWRRNAEVVLGVARPPVKIMLKDEFGEPYPLACPYCQPAQALQIRPNLAWEGDPDRHLPHRRVVLAQPEGIAECARCGWTCPVDRRLGLVVEGPLQAGGRSVR